MGNRARAQARSFAVTIGIAASFASVMGLAAVGRTPTSPGVSPTGEATYSIPIFAPPGTHGMTPQIALVYSHRNGSTLVGAGWSIAGLSAITRCPRTWAADAEARDVRNDASDRFCLDGNKLRLTGGTYGQPGATYQTEIETFSRVKSYGAAGNGPAYFIVEAKNGLIYEYGNTPNSRIESVGQPTARAWALNKIRDRSHNEISFIYDEGTTNGAYQIDSIEYTSNPNEGLAAAYEIDFVWEAKPANDVETGYIAGSEVQQIKRLDRIDVKYNTTVVRSFDLTYEAALSSTSKSRLQSIKECSGSSSECFPPTTFSYQNGVPGFSGETSTGVSVPTKPLALDVNGDGRDDLVYSSSATSGSGTWRVMFANASGGYGSPINTGVTNTNYAGAIRIDYNADGLEDLLVPYSGGTWWVMLGTASGLSAPSNTGAPATATGTGSNASALDVNGDGLDDLVWADLVGYAGGDAIRYRLRQWGGGFSATVYNLLGPYPADTMMGDDVFDGGHASPTHVPDINGDGRGDVIVRRTIRQWQDGNNTWRYVRRIDVLCTGAWSTSITNPNASSAPRHGDFNGDGKDDFIYLNQDGYIVARFSTGTGVTGELAITPLGSYADWVILDWDSDGYDDILLAASGTWRLMRSTGESFAAPVATGFTAGVHASVADINGDGLTDLGNAVSGTWRYLSHAGSFPDLLDTATDGFGNTITFDYAPLTSANYSKYDDATFPEQDYTGALYVVDSYSASNGVGGTYTNTHHYYGARLNLQGRGFEGFYAKRSRDNRNNLYNYEYYKQLFPYTGLVFRRDLRQSDGSAMIARVDNTWTSHSYSGPVGNETRLLPYVSQSTERRYEFGGPFDEALTATTTTTNSVHAATGAVYESTATTTEASTANGVQGGASYVRQIEQPTAYLTNDTTNWCIGRPGRIESTNSHNQYGGAAITRTTEIDWNETLCRPEQIVNEPGNAQLQVVQDLEYDDFGNVDSETITGAGMSARTTSINWGTDGQFPRTVTNALSQATTLVWDRAIGAQTSETDPNGILTSWQYDAFGRRRRETRPDNTATTWTYNDCAAYGCVSSNNEMVIVETLLDSSGVGVTDRLIYTDRFDRPIAMSTRALSGAYSWIKREYDALGRLHREGAPCWSAGCTSFWTTASYDALGRLTQISSPVSDSDSSLQTTEMDHEGLTTRVTDAMGKQSTKVANAVGGLARSIDHDNYYQHFDYDVFGNLKRVTDSLMNTLLTNTFNIRGMRTAQVDLAAGSWSYTPNALGEIVSQTNANSQTTTFGHDKLGRVTSRVEPEGTSTFTFGTSAAAKNIGRLALMSGPGYSESFGYDSIGRLQTRTIASDTTYAINYSYNAFGALDTLTYPTSTSGYRLKLKYGYQYGQLLNVSDFNSPSTVFWTANATDARGNVIDETLGNGVQTIRGYDQVTGTIDFIQSDAGATSIQNLSYSWDRVGNLTQRRDVRQNLTENFYYDNLHRLTSTTGPDPITIGYDPRGNITWRTGGFSESEAHTISWYSYNLPSSIEAGTSSSEFFYAPDRSRWKQVASYAGTSEQTIYIGGLMEKVTRGTEISWKHYIGGGSGIIALYTRKSTGTNELAYVTKDHLGSIDSITTSSAAEIARLSFGAWGERRNESTWSGAPSSSDWTDIEDTTRRGFTSHEMLDNLGLTHMNGRVYDQMIGQFASPDPFIDGATVTSGWNRYSYVHNRPLSSADPSGFHSDERGSVSWVNGPDREYTYNDFMALALAGMHGMSLERGAGPRPDFWDLTRFFDVPRGNGVMPWPNEDTPSTDRPEFTPSGSGPFPVQAGNADSWSTGGEFFLSAQFTTPAGTRFTNEEPSALAELRRKYPEWRQMEDRLWRASLPQGPFGGALERFGWGRRPREQGMFVFQSSNGDVSFQTFAASDGARNTLQGSFAIPTGYELIAVFHTHPWAHGGVLGGPIRGPSGGVPGQFNDDADTALRYPGAFHYIRALGHWTRPYPYETYYYGAKAGFQ